MGSAPLTIDTEGDTLRIRITGSLTTAALEPVASALDTLTPNTTTILIDLAGVGEFDTGGAWVIGEFRLRMLDQGRNVQLEGASDAQAALLDTVGAHLPMEPAQGVEPRSLSALLERMGKRTVGAWHDSLSILSFFGLTLQRLARALIMPWRLRSAALVTHMEETGLKAVPIVALMGFLIGVVLAFQGATQLKQFGAEVFVVELISISILRELGILLTAIIVAGRSGSAFAASIGSMKVQEEIDAMQTLGLDPVDVLVVPRTLALLMVLPILGFIASMSGLIGGALMSWIDLGVSPGMFMTRLKENTDVWHLLVGVIKAPFFAMTIGVIACWQAMQVRGSSESVGQRTTAAVVQSIFAVIALDALFSIFFSEIGV
ncbi:MAG: MlaE family lipid ABC transporter permease subunit [Rhodobacteraceae bacterium]|nr:MlaE family lipid ABC transporter permease subunit [Paracoccaceae bacterium]